MAKFRCNMILFDLAELEEFAKALIGQLSSKITKEKEIAGLGLKSMKTPILRSNLMKLN